MISIHISLSFPSEDSFVAQSINIQTQKMVPPKPIIRIIRKMRITIESIFSLSDNVIQENVYFNVYFGVYIISRSPTIKIFLI